MSDQETGAVEKSQALTKFDEPTLRGIVQSPGGASRAVFLPANFGEALEMAKLLASGIGVRAFMRGNVSACMMIVQQSVRWGMDPYAVANKAYFVNDQVAYESQLIAALINTSGEILGRLKISYEGDATGSVGKETLVCKVRGRLASDPDEEREMEQALATIKIRNSPLWQVNPKLQLAYHTQRSWARLYTPEVLLGIYTPDEVIDGVAASIEAQSTARGGKAPDRRDFVEKEGVDADFDEIETVLPESGAPAADSEENTAESASAGAENDQNTAENGEDPGAGDGDSGSPGLTHNDDEDGDNADPVAAAEDDPVAEDPATPSEDPLPLEPLEWATWEREITAEIGEITDRDAFNRLRQRIQPAMDQADDALLGRVQDALTDKLVTLPE